MNFTQNEKISQVTNETLVVGIDISSENYVWERGNKKTKMQIDTEGIFSGRN